MYDEPVLVIMAAGMGSRFGGLKQITPVSEKGELILDFSLYDAMRAGFKKAVLIIKKEHKDDFKQLLSEKAGKSMDIEFVFQEIEDLPKGFSVPKDREKPWGTGHATLAARKVVNGPFAVINADDYYGPTAFQVMYDFLKRSKDDLKYHYAMVGFKVENTLTENGFVSRGICQTSPDHMLTSITERTKIKWIGEEIGYTEDEGNTWENIPKGTFVSMNFWGFTSSFMEEGWAKFPDFLKLGLEENPLKCEYYLPAIVDSLIRENKADVRVLPSQDHWYGVTYKDDYEKVVYAIQGLKEKGIYPRTLW